MDISHSAPAQALGYYYQVGYALYLALTCQEELRDLSIQISIEDLDDIAYKGENGLLKLLQLKHHLDTGKALTDRSPDLWKTIRVWSELLVQKKITLPDKTRLYLITTGKAPNNSIASLLSSGNKRDSKEAHKRLAKIAAKPTATLQKSFDAFNALSAQQQQYLLGAIEILDLAPTITDIDQLIQSQFHGVRFENRQKIYEELTGWWFLRVVRHLGDGSTEPIIKREIEEMIALFNDDLKKKLPDECFADEPNLADPKWKTEIFVQQLRAIAIEGKPVSLAIGDYHKAFTQRSKWLEAFLISLREIERYETNLIREWKEYFYDLQEELNCDENAGDKQLESFGRELYKKVRHCDIFVSPEFTSKYMTRGSYHILANEPKPRVYWHPKFTDCFLNKF